MTSILYKNIAKFSAALTLIFLLLTVKAFAYPEFKPGRIIDDAVFTNKYSMSTSQIQSFLNNQVLTCDTNTPGYTGGSGTVYSPPWICLKDYYENPSSTYTVSYNFVDKDGSNKTSAVTYYRNNAYEFTSLTPVYINGDYRQGIKHLTATIKNINGVVPFGAKSAAQIIHEAAQQYSINPQVLLVMLQKEQGLVTDKSPEAWRYQAAMGYECDDSSPCKSQFAGFSRQVSASAWQLRNDFNGIDTPGFWSLYGKGINDILYNPNRSCGSSEVNIENQATAVLYKYTPYQPNAGSIAHKLSGGRYYSTVLPDCGAYGNLNFWKLFIDWFDSTLVPEINITTNLTLTPSNPVIGQTVTASFQIKNNSDSPVSIGHMIVAARDPAGRNVDFPLDRNVTIAANSTYTYSMPQVFNVPGNYNMFISNFHGSSWYLNFPNSSSSSIVRQRTISVGDNPLVTTNLTLTPSNPVIGQTVTASFQIKNNSDSPVSIGHMIVAARDPAGRNVDFPLDRNVTIAANSTYTYSMPQVFNVPGNYNMFISNFHGSSWYLNFPNSSSSSIVRLISASIN